MRVPFHVSGAHMVRPRVPHNSKSVGCDQGTVSRALNVQVDNQNAQELPRKVTNVWVGLRGCADRPLEREVARADDAANRGCQQAHG